MIRQLEMPMTNKELNEFCASITNAQKVLSMNRNDTILFVFMEGLKALAEAGGLDRITCEIDQKMQELQSNALVSDDELEKSGYVYFLQARGNLFKVGSTRMPPLTRKATLQTGCPFALRLYAYLHFQNCKKKERSFHKAFKSYKMINEWFRIKPLVVEEMIVNEIVTHFASDDYSLGDMVVSKRIHEKVRNRLAKVGIELASSGY